MKFYALGCKYQKDKFYDFGTETDTSDIFKPIPSCYLPTRKIAELMIDNEVGDEYFVVEVELNNDITGICVTDIKPDKGYWDSYDKEESS